MMKLNNLETLFYPESVAVVGATENEKKMGCYVMLSLLESFNGKIYPVNPSRDKVFSLKSYPDPESLPEAPDLAIIAVPREHIYDTVKRFLEKGTRAFVIITAGFGEAEIDDGEELHRKLKELVDSKGAVVIGPNTFGFVNTELINASFSPFLFRVKRGKIALVSQSGGVCHLLVPYAMRHDIGFSKIVGLGNRLNIDFVDMLNYLAHDNSTEAIVLYIEGVEKPLELFERIGEVVKIKPVVVMKSGRFEKAGKASKAHTGSFSGEYRIFVSALKQNGAIIAETLEELVSFAKALSMQKPLFGNRIAVVSLVAGLGIVACDVCSDSGFLLAEFSQETKKELYEILPPYTIRDNPVDLGFVANDPDLCGSVIELIAKDRNVDGMVVNYIYSWSGRYLEVPVKSIIKAGKMKPLTLCLNYPPGLWDNLKIELENGGIPVYPTPEIAVKSLKALREYARCLENLSGKNR